MKKVLGFAGGLCGLLLGSMVAFYIWASSGVLSEGDFEAGELIASSKFEASGADDTITLVTYNVGYASGLSNNTGDNASESEYAANLETINRALAETDPDLVVFQEIDYDSKRSYHRDQLTDVADALGLRFRVRGYNWDKKYLPFPYWPPSEHFGSVLSGQALASGFPIAEHSKLTLVAPEERPFFYNQFYLDRTIQISKVEVGGTILTILNVHLEAYMNGTRQKQSIEIVEAVRAQGEGPLILVGDFNAQPPWVQGGADELGRPDVTIANILEQTGLQKAIPETAYDDMHQHLTFPSGNPSLSLDHIFYSEHIERLDARVLGAAGTGSDHLPVLMTFRIKASAGKGN